MEPKTPYLHSGVLDLLAFVRQEVAEVSVTAEPDRGWNPKPLICPAAYLTPLPKDSKFLRFD